MVIIRVQGGLGNQMFQYALYKELECRGKEVSLDIGIKRYSLPCKDYKLETLYHVKANYASREMVSKMSNKDFNKFHRILNRLFKFKKRTHYKDICIGYNEKALLQSNIYLDGYWQSEEYFKDIKSKIRETFFLEINNNIQNEIVKKKILSSISVSIHIRRIDYADSPLYNNICTLEYYEHSINYIIAKLGKENLEFFIFSDDNDWVKKNLFVENAIYIDWNINSNDYMDMQLMARCKHNIIANSSFSWWGAWLNDNPNKIVICPSKWTNNKNINLKKIVPDEWIRVKTD